MIVDVEFSAAAAGAFSALLSALATSLSAAAYELWFAPLRLVGECDGALVLSAPPHVRDWVERRYLALLADAAAPRSVVLTARKEEKERKTRDDDPSTPAPPERGKREEDAR